MDVLLRRKLWGCFTICILLAWPTAADVMINADPPGDVQNEIRIAVNPTNPLNLVTAYNDRPGGTLPTTLGVSFSNDGGATWTDRQLGVPNNPNPPFGSLNVIFDPFISAAPSGDFYAGYVATEPVGGGTSGLFIERSVDGGATWSGPTTISLDSPALGPVDPTYRFNDRPHSTTDTTGRTHVAWIKDVGVNQPTSDIHYSVSGPPGPPMIGNPTGLNFTSPVTVNDFPGGVDMANAPSVSSHPNGTTYIAWIDVNVQSMDAASGTIFIDSTTIPPGPGPFPPPAFGVDATVAVIDPLPRHLSTSLGVADGARAGSYPVIVVDPVDPSSQTVYLAFAAENAGGDEGDIFFTKTTDGGTSWTTPLRVNDDATTFDQMHPAIALKNDGTIDIIWYDKRNSVNDDAWDVYFASSTDGGNSFLPNLRVSDFTAPAPFNQPGTEPWLGEYLGLAVTGNSALIAFASQGGPLGADTRGDVFFDSLVNPTAVVPEPPSLLLALLCCSLLLLFRRFS